MTMLAAVVQSWGPSRRSRGGHARVAQWIERLPPEQEVVGSNPISGTSYVLWVVYITWPRKFIGTVGCGVSSIACRMMWKSLESRLLRLAKEREFARTQEPLVQVRGCDHSPGMQRVAQEGPGLVRTAYVALGHGLDEDDDTGEVHFRPDITGARC